MKLHENRQLFSDAINAASQPINEGAWESKVFLLRKTTGFVVHYK